MGRNADAEVLANFFTKTNGTGWTKAHNWDIDNLCDFCDWTGVDCERTRESVTSLKLDGYGVMGSIPNNIVNLGSLESLILPNNAISGSIPTEIHILGVLKALNLK